MSVDHSEPNRLLWAKQTFMRWLHDLTIFPFLLPVFFVLHIARYYFGAIPAAHVLQIIGIYLLVAAGIYFLLKQATKDKLSSGFATTMLIGLLLYWGDLIRILHLTENYYYHLFFLLVYLITVVVLCLLIKRLKKPVAAGFFYYLNTLFSVFVLVELGFIGFYAIDSINKSPIIIEDPREAGIDQSLKKGNNIYLLLFDEYASTSVLRQYWAMDNSPMDSFLSGSGFVINKASRANYCWTQFSMASLLNMDYFTEYSQPHNYAARNSTPQCFVAIKESRVAEALKNAGYVVRTHSLFDVADQPKKEIPTLMVSERKLITFNTFYNFLVREYIPYFSERSAIKKNPAHRYSAFYLTDDYNNAAANMVMREAKTQTQVPKFVYAHFMMPHHPFYYDSSDIVMPMDKIKGISRQEEPKYYWYNVQHTNGKLRQMIDSIQRHDPSASIIVLGDHGYRYHLYEDDKHPEYFRNMSAVYFPDKNYASVPDSFTNVNVFRIVLNKVCGTNYPLLENNSCTLSYKKD